MSCGALEGEGGLAAEEEEPARDAIELKRPDRSVYTKRGNRHCLSKSWSEDLLVLHVRTVL